MLKQYQEVVDTGMAKGASVNKKPKSFITWLRERLKLFVL